ncbi:hypothetical protein L209DRAFT_752147 [Thermothelomyces heterothallicus CBS 203.75]
MQPVLAPGFLPYYVQPEPCHCSAHNRERKRGLVGWGHNTPILSLPYSRQLTHLFLAQHFLKRGGGEETSSDGHSVLPAAGQQDDMEPQDQALTRGRQAFLNRLPRLYFRKQISLMRSPKCRRLCRCSWHTGGEPWKANGAERWQQSKTVNQR